MLPIGHQFPISGLKNNFYCQLLIRIYLLNLIVFIWRSEWLLKMSCHFGLEDIQKFCWMVKITIYSGWRSLKADSSGSLGEPTEWRGAWVWFATKHFLLSWSCSWLPPSAAGGIWSRHWCPFGWGAQRSRCGSSAEGVPQGHARPSPNQGALHGFYQHHMWASAPIS